MRIEQKKSDTATKTYFWYKLAIFVSLVGVPLYLIRIPIEFFGLFALLKAFRITISIHDVFLLFLVLISAWYWLKEKEIFFLHLKNISSFFWMSVGCVFVGTLLSAFVSGITISMLGILLSWFVLPLLGSLSIWLALKKKIIYFKQIFIAILVGTTLVSLVSIGYVIQNIFTYDDRLSAVYLSPNHLAMYVVVGAVIAWFCARYIRCLQNKGLLWSVFGLHVTVLYFTFSYTTWIAFFGVVFLGEGLCFIQQYRLLKAGLSKAESADDVGGVDSLDDRRLESFQKKDKEYPTQKKLVVFGLWGFVVFFVFFLLVFSQWNTVKFQDMIHIADRSSVASRLMIWRSAWDVGVDNWFFGIGPGNFQEEYLARQSDYPPYLEWAVPQPHNLFLSFWLQGGVIGALGFILGVILFLRSIWLWIQNQKDYIYILPALLLVCFFIIGLVDTPFWKNDLMFLWWIILFTVSCKHCHN